MNVLNNDITISKALLEKVISAFPSVLPVDRVDLEQLRFLQGQQSVIAYLESLYEESLEEN